MPTVDVNIYSCKCHNNISIMLAMVYLSAVAVIDVTISPICHNISYGLMSAVAVIDVTISPIMVVIVFCQQLKL